LLAGLLVSNLIQPPEPVQFALIGVAVAPLALALALLDPAPRRAGARSLLSLGAWIGTWSFSIYVFHLPVVRLLAMVLARVGRYPGLVEVLAVYVIGAVVVALIYPLWSLTERWSPLLRDTGLRLLQTCGRSLEVRGRRIPEPRGIAVPARSHAVGQHPEADSRTAAGG
jgi:peptidoglycan/LPS O-acetylase OafA/YrhL